MKTRPIAIRLSDSERADLARAAKAELRTSSGLGRILVIDGLRRRKRQKEGARA